MYCVVLQTVFINGVENYQGTKNKFKIVKKKMGKLRKFLQTDVRNKQLF